MNYKDFLYNCGCSIGEYCLGPVDIHHVRTRGAGGKDESNIIPLCRLHHSEVHSMGKKSFEKKYKIDMALLASLLQESFDNDFYSGN